MSPEVIDPSLFSKILANGPLAGVLGFFAWAFFRGWTRAIAKFEELSERGIKALENNNAALAELRRSNERVEAAVAHCPGGRGADRIAAMNNTQRMERAI